MTVFADKTKVGASQVSTEIKPFIKGQILRTMEILKARCQKVKQSRIKIPVGNRHENVPGGLKWRGGRGRDWFKYTFNGFLRVPD